jgi:M3 family oligoendopeptidase
MKFTEMPYVRLEKQPVIDELTELTSQLKAAEDYSSARRIFIAVDDLLKKVMTQETLSSIRHSINTNDEFYDAENKYWNAVYPELEEYFHTWKLALLDNKFRSEFEEEFGSLYFINTEIELKTFSPDIIAQLQQENDLIQDYDNLIASAQIDFKGGTYTLSQLSPFKTDADDDTRMQAWTAEGKWFKDNQEKLDEIYDRLVHLRDEMGRKLGYKDFTQLGYYRMGRNCYTKEDVKKFRESVVKYLVPVADGIYREQAKRLGKEYPMSFADNALMFRSGNARPSGSADDIVKAAKDFYDSLSPETSEFFSTMLDNELMDLLSTQGKQAGGYCTSLGEYEYPFIFANFNGTRADVETVTHEAGHAFAQYINRHRVPMETVWPSLEACEVHSMSMEFFAWKNAESFFGSDTRKFYYSHLAGSLCFIPYGTMVDHFQHIVYEKPDMTPRERHGVWKELLGIYMPWMKLDGEIPFYSDGEAWQRQLHIYSMPFYYIDYCLAQTVALEFWARMQSDYDAAWKTYFAYTSLGGSKTFTELLKCAGLDSPFEEKCLRDVCNTAKKWLEGYDLTGIE